MEQETKPWQPVNKVRFITATSLYDGHDAAINIIRRILLSSGAEVIHLGHNRSVDEIVNAAIQEDVQGIAVSCYQGGHIEFFKYLMDLLKKRGAAHIKVFGGGGGVIIPKEIAELHKYGVSRIFSPEDGRNMGLQGMINMMLKACDFQLKPDLKKALSRFKTRETGAVNALISAFERSAAGQSVKELPEIRKVLGSVKSVSAVVGITGTGGAGKSSLIDDLVCHFLRDFKDKTIAVLAVDPSRRKSGGALLGDRIRMNYINSPRVFMRSFASRDSGTELSPSIKDAVKVAKAAGYDLVIVETGGIGQGSAGIVEVCDVSLYVMTGEFGALSQLEKINMLDFADIVVLNKFDRGGAQDAYRGVCRQYCVNHKLSRADAKDIPVFCTVASRFNDPGTNLLYGALIGALNKKKNFNWRVKEDAVPAGESSSVQNGTGQYKSSLTPVSGNESDAGIIPPAQAHYLGEISRTVRDYRQASAEQSDAARKLYQVNGTRDLLKEPARSGGAAGAALVSELDEMSAGLRARVKPETQGLLENFFKTRECYRGGTLVTRTRDKELRTELYTTTLSGTKVPKVAVPAFEDWGEIVKWCMKENLPGFFPYTAGVFPFKRVEEDPKRQFAGEGSPLRTNKRFHLLSDGEQAKRLSTAFDSVTLYGSDPGRSPDIFGKVGESGVSVCTLEDIKKLYSGFDLCAPGTSVSMTINGPAPIMLAMFFNAAIEGEVAKFVKKEKRAPGKAEYAAIAECTLQTVRGTVQADILKEDQGQNTCIFSTAFALKMMGDMQQYFIDHKVRNYYSVSISGYHIAEAGANPISQLAFTLANGFTFVEYYLSRGMRIDDFAHNLSFFFSNGLDCEYAVIGRVARRIWSVVMKNRYGASERSQKLKYHIQTSGRSLHAQDMAFNDIRSTLQALMAIYDNCNSLHTNAYDEAVTTPTEESVRRAVAIQLIITRELGLAKNENSSQGSFIIEELTDLVEEAVLAELERLDLRGGVLGAMETQYQRGKIQDESMVYEEGKHNGTLPIVGVNTFLDPAAAKTGYQAPAVITRASKAEKEGQIKNLLAFQKKNRSKSEAALKKLQRAAQGGGNIFAELMETVKYASLGEITGALYEIGGRYRRNM
ncbi:MAG: methylmalonyl-CoA mutase [Elusimicrobia bacterium CG1_02_56_21]|nr:MAG: methylmalonyl-CoA mutase [Elusimicrobia bacterium CG1_02_56_21]